MSFADTYFKRFISDKSRIPEKPSKDLFLSIVIPSYNEDELCLSLQSLKDCFMPEKSVEVIVVINSGENTPEDIVLKNRKTYEKAQLFAQKNNTGKLKFHILKVEKLPGKFAGVGLARKIGMDEALRRFDYLEKPEGLIAGFDADALTEKNYLIETEKFFKENKKTKAASIYFEHPTEGKKYDTEIYRKIINYELHLRYFVEALRYAGFPFAYHTIGSSFVVKAGVYASQGGMNRKKAGEDFYFLQKIIPLGDYGEINTTKVIPSPRVSDRVPFGTGAAVAKMIKNNTNDFGTYDFEAFELLKTFFENTELIFSGFSYSGVPDILKSFLKKNNFEKDLIKIKSKSPSFFVFEKNFFLWFNAFRLIKFLNFSHEQYFTEKKVKEQSSILLKKKYPEIKIPETEKEILFLYRKIQKREF